MPFARFVPALLALATTATAQTTPLEIRRAAIPSHPFTVVGERGAVLGTQDGVFEIWQNPVKVLRDLRITAHLANYDTPLDLNATPATITVTPAETVITLGHAAIMVREHLLIDRTGLLPESPAVAYFEIESTRPADLVFSFAPVLQRQWPAPNFGTPGTGWRTVPGGSAYILFTDDPHLYAVVALPGATPGPSAPYQERVHTQRVEMHVHFDPATDGHRIYPLLTAVSDFAAPATRAAQDALLTSTLGQQAAMPLLLAANTAFYERLFARTLELTTPDSAFNDAFRWAQVSIDQSRIRSTEGTGLAAGWSTSDDSARPGFGWFFGRDTLWSLYAVNSEGDFELTRQAIDFLLLHQRADGKMMHEYSQTAPLVDWQSFPYLYAAADSTPLFVMQMEDYVRASGDTDYLKKHWQNVLLAYGFLRAHTDNGLYSNTEGTGWVEEWPGAMPHQEIYLASLDVQATRALGHLAGWMGEASLAAQADALASENEMKLAAYRQPGGLYAFSRNADSTYDATPSIFPAVAWWQSPGLPGSDAMLDAWASSDFSVDWGIRSVPQSSPAYDPISYHHGSVWPLYTGWVALAEFRAGRSLQATERVRQTLALDTLQDLGATTEVLSGEFFEPLSRSSSHQLWSSAMAITPVVRGLLGLQPDALRHTLQVKPHLPAAWDQVTASHLLIGGDRFELRMVREREVLRVEVRSAAPTVLCLNQSAPCTAAPVSVHAISLPLPAVEVDLPLQPAVEGERSHAVHVLHQSEGAGVLGLELEGPAGSTQTLILRRNRPAVTVHLDPSAILTGDTISVHFPSGSGYTRRTVSLRW